MNCILCSQETAIDLNSLNDLEYNTPGQYDFRICHKCSLVSISPLLDQKGLEALYPPTYHGFNTNSNFLISKLYSLVYYFRFKKYSKYLESENPSLLDVGCADATYFKNLSRKVKNLTCYGVENNAAIAEKAQNNSLSVFLGTIDDVPSNLSFDLIIMNNLIEHVIDPLKELKAAKKLLKPSGKIFIETPNTDSWDFKIMKRYWGGLHTPRHTFLFNPHSFYKISKQAKLSVQTIFFPINTDHWALSIQNYFQTTNLLRCKLKNGRAWYFKYLLLLFIPMNFVQKMFGKTGSMEIILTNE